MNGRLIGLMGAAGAGKDAVGRVLVERHSFTRVAFADALKAEARAKYGWNGVKDDKGRRLLQRIGVAMREVSPTYWIDLVVALIDESDVPVVVTDVRFTNEVDAIRSRGGALWRIERPGVVAASGHVSEHEWRRSNPDLWIHNACTRRHCAALSDGLCDELVRDVALALAH